MTDQRYLALADIAPQPTAAPLNVLLLADDAHVANVVQDHINAFKQHSRHAFTVVNPIGAKIVPGVLDPVPDAILIHYSIFILGDYFLPGPWRTFVRQFPGPKAQIIQDEFRHINAMKARMAELGVGAVFSSMEVPNLEKVYGGEILERTRVYSCLPGYIADSFKTFAPPPISARTIDVVYRGRQVPFRLGRSGQEKSAIGEQMLAIAAQHALKVDITSKEERRIYGSKWNDFLMSARTTLGVEGGMSIFDFDDTIDAACRQYIEANPDATFEQVWQAVLKPYEGNVVHRTITPKLLEAVACKTALVLYPGRYRGILEPHRHYIPFEPDGSNAADVIAKIKDTTYLQGLVDRTYADLIDREDLSTRFYVRQVDAVLTHLEADLRLTPAVFSEGKAAAIQAALVAQSAADETALRLAAEQAAAQERILREHAEFVQRQLDEMRRASEDAARKQEEQLRQAAEVARLEQARVEREHAEFVARQQEQMRRAANDAQREQARIEAEHAAFVKRQQEQMQPDLDKAAREQERIDREHAAFVEQQREQMRLAQESAAREQERIEREHAEFVRKQQEQLRPIAEEAAREQERIERAHAKFVEQQREQMRLAEENAAREQARIEREHAEFVRAQQEQMRPIAEEAAREQERIEREHAEFVQAQREQMRQAAEQAAREQARLEREHNEFVRLQKEQMRLASEQATRDQARIDKEHADFLKR